MNKIIKYTLASVLAISLANCTSNFDDINTDPNGISYESLTQLNNHIGSSFTPMFLNVFNVTPAWNYQLQQGLLGDVYSGSGDWLDQSGKGNDGVVNGATWTASGWFDFDGVDDYIDVGDLGINMSQFTVEVWFKPNVVENYRNVIDCNYGTPDPADGIVKSGNIGPRLEMNSVGTLAWNWGASRSANDPFFTAAVVSSGLAANTWHHTAIVVSGNQATNGSSYYNGSLASANGGQTSGGSTAWYGEFQNVNIGRGFFLAGNRYFDGELGEVRIYPRPLTPAQVFQNYNATREKYTGVPASTDPGLTSTRTPA